MSGYIGATVVGLETTAADVTGDITATDDSPELTLKNSTKEDSDGGRESKITFKGEQSGGEESTLAQIESAHDGTSDDQKGDLIFKTNDGSDGASPTEAMRIDSSQNVGIGVAAPESGLHLSDGTNVGSPQNSSRKATLTIEAGSEGSADIQLLNASYNHIFFGDAADANIGYQVYDHTNNSLQFGVNAAERMRIDSSGRVMIGTTTEGQVQAENLTIADSGNMGMTLRSTDSGETSIFFSDGTSGAAEYAGWLQYIHSSNAMTFGANATERMRINSGGDISIGTTSTNPSGDGNQGICFDATGHADFSTHASTQVLDLNRLADGNIIIFRSANVNEGSISISGTTTSYNGGHLSRWSQLTDGSEDTSIVKGTVMTNLDQMAVWHHEAVAATYYEEGDELPDGVSVGDEKTAAVDAYTEDNEQLNCMAVSSVEGDPNVAGVFVNWDHDDDDFNDMNVAMTGDMVIRIAKGVTVARGDLLMSAGDGTAKPQGDDIVRSKTIAKVTSTNVSHTYDDGSFLVPCVLMAC